MLRAKKRYTCANRLTLLPGQGRLGGHTHQRYLSNIGTNSVRTDIGGAGKPCPSCISSAQKPTRHAVGLLGRPEL